jgi:hypothetical protein
VGAAAVRKQMKCTINNLNTFPDIQFSSVTQHWYSSLLTSGTNHLLHFMLINFADAYYDITKLPSTKSDNGAIDKNEHHDMNRTKSRLLPSDQNITQETKPHPPSNELQERARQFRASPFFWSVLLQIPAERAVQFERTTLVTRR